MFNRLFLNASKVAISVCLFSMGLNHAHAGGEQSDLLYGSMSLTWLFSGSGEQLFSFLEDLGGLESVDNVVVVENNRVSDEEIIQQLINSIDEPEGVARERMNRILAEDPSYLDLFKDVEIRFHSSQIRTEVVLRDVLVCDYWNYEKQVTITAPAEIKEVFDNYQNYIFAPMIYGDAGISSGCSQVSTQMNWL